MTHQFLTILISFLFFSNLFFSLFFNLFFIKLFFIISFPLNLVIVFSYFFSLFYFSFLCFFFFLWVYIISLIQFVACNSQIDYKNTFKLFYDKNSNSIPTLFSATDTCLFNFKIKFLLINMHWIIHLVGKLNLI